MPLEGFRDRHICYWARLYLIFQVEGLKRVAQPMLGHWYCFCYGPRCIAYFPRLDLIIFLNETGLVKLNL
jgi:hypothetical protein